MQSIQALVLDNKRCSRLSAVLGDMPLSLLKVCNTHLCDYTKNLLHSHNIDNISFALNGDTKRLCEHLDDESIRAFECENDLAAIATSWDRKSDMIVISQNVVCAFDLTSALLYHSANNPLVTAILKEADNYRDYTAFSVDTKRRITAILKKPSLENVLMGGAFTGVVILSADFLGRLCKRDEGMSLKSDIIKLAIDENKAIGYFEKGYWCEITDVESFVKCNHDIADAKTGIEIPAHRDINGVFYKAPLNYNGVAIRPPVYIGKGVYIEAGAIIENGAVLEDNSIIHKGVRVSGGIVKSGAEIFRNCDILNCVIGENATIGENSKCCDFAVVGKNSKVMSGATIHSKVLIFEDKVVEPNSEVYTDVTVRNFKRYAFDDEGHLGSELLGITPLEAVKIGMAIATAVEKGEQIAIGANENNPVVDAIISGITASGVDACVLKGMPFSSLLYCAKKINAALVINVTFSSCIRVKVTEKSGLFVTRKTERIIENAINQNDVRVVPLCEYGRVLNLSDLKFMYKKHLEKILPQKLSGVLCKIRCSDMRVCELFDEIIRPKNDIKGECITFHITNDTTRLSAYGEGVGYVFYESLVLLCIKILSQYGVLKFSLPYTFTSVAEDYAKKFSCEVYRYCNTPYDDTEKPLREIAAGDDNSFIHDSITLMCIIISYLSKEGITLSQAIADIPQFCSNQRFLCINDTNAEILRKLEGSTSYAKEGVIYENADSKAIVRPVKSGKGIMIFAQSYQYETAAAICDEIERKLKNS